MGNVTVEIEQAFTTHYPAAPDADVRIELGQSAWNDQDLCTTNVKFVGFGIRTFTESEKTNPAPEGKVYWVITTATGTNSYAGIQATYSQDRTVGAIVRVSPDIARWPQFTLATTFNYLGSHEIGHARSGDLKSVVR
jgi:hypothetical protein